MRSFLFFLPLCVFVFCQLSTSKNAHTSTSEAEPDSLYKHDPYDISQARVTDSTDVYVTKTSKVKYLLRSPRYILVMMVYPLEKFALQVEYANLWIHYYKFFTNKTGTFGLFPHGQLGGETGTGVGVRLFHTNILGHENALTAHYIYSGEQGQFCEGLYVDPNIWDTGLLWKIQGGYLQTKNRNANINGAIDDDESRLFELKKVDVETSVEWRLKTDEIASIVPQFKMVGRIGFSQRVFMPVLGGLQPLSDPGSSPQARLLKGLGTIFKFYRIGLRVMYDDRDYKKPVRQLSHPPNYRFPGRIVTQFGDQFYFARDIGYPERGGFITLEGDWVTGPDRIAFYKIRAEAARYITLFWKNRILVLHARMDKVRSVGDGFVPYTELIQLGGNESTRGYTRGYFRGQGALQFNVEYRYPIWDYSNVFLFWDEGQIFDHFGDLRWGGFHSSWGGGIAFRTETDLLGKIKIGHSTANRFLIGFTMNQAF